MSSNCSKSAPPAGACVPCPVDEMQQTTLHALAPGVCATIVCVNCHARFRRRLAEMGVLPGVRIQMKRTAPLGDPIAFQLKGYQLSLRREDAAQIVVLPCDVSPTANPTASLAGEGRNG